MKKRIGKIICLVVGIILFCTLFSCQITKNTVEENVNRVITYEENITVFDIEDAIVQAAKKGEQSIVGVTATQGVTSGFGSGVVIKSEKAFTGYKVYVLTNYHVVFNKNRKCTVNVYVGSVDKSFPATILAYDKDLDVAILVCDPSMMITPATLGDSTKYEKGRYAIAIGNPYDLKGFYASVTVGNVSDPSRFVKNSEGVSNYYIQHTAPINGGNSGGGLFDLHGNLMGINTWKYAETEIEGMAFAIPIHTIKAKFPTYF